MTIRHFLTLKDLTSSELDGLIKRSIELKQMLCSGELYQPLQAKVLAMVFDKSSTRTRVSFETAMIQFGGSSIFLSPRDTQLGRGEPIEDSARVLSSMVDCVMLRTYEHRNIERFSQYSQVPVINALTDTYHPCQLLADMLTYVEQRGEIKGKTVAWIGDGNNMCNSYINAAQQFDFTLNIACPPGYEPALFAQHSNDSRLALMHDAKEAVRNADLVVTDVWASMGQEEEAASRTDAFTPYQVNAALMALAKKNALFMHCLPAHRGEEVTADVLDGPQSVVWQEAENRLHSQKALLELLLVDHC
ncbi:MAG: ornithine carbamoyltransferase [Gammaproteobacteria bacterium]|nr:ornithine carbamoyltransferase [Gammaproteobacteria bacterium]